MDRIKQALGNIMFNRCYQISKKLELLDCCYTMHVDSYIPSNIRKNIFDNFILPLLNAASVTLIRMFYLKNIDSILKNVLISALHGSEAERLESMNLKIGSLRLLASLYAKSPKDNVHSQNSELTQKAFNLLRDNLEISRDAKYNGKEMSQFLVKRLKKMRSEIIDGSSEVKERFRIYQCEAYNTMMAVISCIQEQEKFYNAFLFKEDVGSSEFIWSRIINSNQQLNFPLEMEDANQRRQKIVSIRKAGSTAEVNYEGGTGKPRSDHYLRDSSLSQDVTTFDFNDNFSSLQLGTQAKPDEVYTGNDVSSQSTSVIEIEIDSLNDHECMSHLIGVIRYMTDKEMYPIPKTEEERNTIKLPSWMESLKSKLADGPTERNVKLFILRLILNCNEIFQPFTKHFLFDILSLITTEHVWPNEQIVNYFSLDLTAMLLSWSESTSIIPNGSLMERNFVSTLFEELVKGLDQSRREIFRYILDVIRLLVELWKSCLNINYATVYKFFSKMICQVNTLVPAERYSVLKQQCKY